jgi:hypothetical protein
MKRHAAATSEELDTQAQKQDMDNWWFYFIFIFILIVFRGWPRWQIRAL